MSPGAKCDFRKNVYDLLVLVTALGRAYQADGHLLYHFTIKSHYLAHVAQYAQFVNPSLRWCYNGEDFMQRVRKIAANCQRGTKPIHVPAKILLRYCTGVGFMLGGRNALLA